MDANPNSIMFSLPSHATAAVQTVNPAIMSKPV